MKSIRKVVCAAALATATALAGVPAHAQEPGDTVVSAKNPIAGQYIVVLNDSVSNVDATVRRLAGSSKVLFTYRNALKGFAVQASAKQARKIAADAVVDSVQQNAVARINEADANVVQGVPAPPNTWWGLNRIDQRTLPPNAAGGYHYFSLGSAVTAYTVDTGILYTHNEFGGRASFGIDVVGGVAPPGSDCHGHGTHVSGTIAGSTYGVAKGAKLKSVRVLDCGGSGTWAGVIAGLDWIRANAVKPAVVNMSLGGGFVLAANIATNDLIESGVTVAVAAGNSNDDACNYSPASTLAAITVGATGDWGNTAAPISDTRAGFSNWGPCLDIFAPGAEIRSAWIGSNSAWATISGTSMASPHVAGVAALILQGMPTALPATVRNYMMTFATNGVVVDPGPGSVNRLLYSGNAATLTLNATPEPITKGQSVTSSGSLTVGGMTLAGKTIQIWFDPVSGGAVLKGTTTTSSVGTYAKSFAQHEDGSWFARFAGAPLVGPDDSPLDFVDCTNC